MEVIRRGAEAEIRRGEWMGRDVMFKSRVPKAYRHPELDSALRSSRTRNEARLMQEARRLGVPTPIIYDIDVMGSEIVMQEIKGQRVKDIIDSPDAVDKEKVCSEIGRMVALLHEGGMTHGDLTTSNMLLSEGRVWFIDFSLGGKNATVEEMGVDLHLLKEAFQSAHSDMLGLFDVIMGSYASHFSRGGEVIKKVMDIEGRGRYT